MKKFFAWVASLFSPAQKSKKQELQQKREEWLRDRPKMTALETLIRNGQVPTDDYPTELLIKVYMSTNVIEDQNFRITVIRLLKARPDFTARQLLKLKDWTPVMSTKVNAAIEDALNTPTRTKELKEMISEK